MTPRELKTTRLDLAFYARDVVTVARELIGMALVNGPRAGLIVETEAYRGGEDLASHARFGATARTAVMFGRAGVAYVYLCYGIHELFNVVTGAEGEGQAVLIRAVAPLAGFDAATAADASVGRGPGKVTRALGLSRAHDRKDLLRGPLFLASVPGAPAPPVAVGPRVGVDFAGAWAAEPYRFWWRDHPAVSRSARSTSTRRMR